MSENERKINQPYQPPSGKDLVRIDRRGRDGQGDQVLRVALDDYEGHKFISIRLFDKGRDGRGLWPTRKGISVRTGELASVVAALQRAQALLEEPSPAVPSPQRLPRGQRPDVCRNLPAIPASAPADFDEFASASASTPPWE